MVPRGAPRAQPPGALQIHAPPPQNHAPALQNHAPAPQNAGEPRALAAWWAQRPARSGGCGHSTVTWMVRCTQPRAGSSQIARSSQWRSASMAWQPAPSWPASACHRVRSTTGFAQGACRRSTPACTRSGSGPLHPRGAGARRRAGLRRRHGPQPPLGRSALASPARVARPNRSDGSPPAPASWRPRPPLPHASGRGRRDPPRDPGHGARPDPARPRRRPRRPAAGAGRQRSPGAGLGPR